MRVKVEAHLRDAVTGDTRVYEKEHEESDGVIYHWTEGNYGCDCNRSLLLWEWSEENALECSRDKNRVRLDKLVIDGDEITEGLNDQ